MNSEMTDRQSAEARAEELINELAVIGVMRPMPEQRIAVALKYIRQAENDVIEEIAKLADAQEGRGLYGQEIRVLGKLKHPEGA